MIGGNLPLRTFHLELVPNAFHTDHNSRGARTTLNVLLYTDAKILFSQLLSSPLKPNISLVELGIE
jgi:hypothetical protein